MITGGGLWDMLRSLMPILWQGNDDDVCEVVSF